MDHRHTQPKWDGWDRGEAGRQVPDCDCQLLVTRCWKRSLAWCHPILLLTQAGLIHNVYRVHPPCSCILSRNVLVKDTQHSQNLSRAHGWTASYDKVPSIKSPQKRRRIVLGMEKPQHLLLYKTEVPGRNWLQEDVGNKAEIYTSLTSLLNVTILPCFITTVQLLKWKEKKSLHLIKESKRYREGKHGSLKR